MRIAPIAAVPSAALSQRSPGRVWLGLLLPPVLLLPARLVVYFVLALWLFRGPNCGYGRVMVKLVDALYHRRRGQQLLDGVLDPDGWVDAGDGRRWRPPNISSLSRARTRLGADPLHMLFEQVAGPVGAPDAAGVFCCGLRVMSMDGSTTDVPDSTLLPNSVTHRCRSTEFTTLA